MDAFKPTTAHKLDFKILMKMQPCPLTESFATHDKNRATVYCEEF